MARYYRGRESYCTFRKFSRGEWAYIVIIIALFVNSQGGIGRIIIALFVNSAELGVTVIALSNRPNEIESAVTNVSKCVSFLSNFKVFVVVFFWGGVVFLVVFLSLLLFLLWACFCLLLFLLFWGEGWGCFVLFCLVFLDYSCLCKLFL